MEFADIKYKMMKLGITFADLDRKYNFPRSTCRMAINVPHSKAEQVIADTLGLEPKEIWPSRYNSKGIRLQPQPTYVYHLKSKGDN